MDESQAELCKLELQASHIQRLIDHDHGSEDEEDEGEDEEEDEEADTSILDVGALSLGPGEDG